MLRISCVAEQLVASEAGDSPVVLVATDLTSKFGVACINSLFFYFFLYGSTALCWTLAAFFSFLILYRVGAGIA
jgi:hypothetical protein